MEHAGLFPPLLATCLPAQPAPTPAPPSARPAEPTRIITDPLSGRSYCKGRLLGKVPIGVGVVGGIRRDSMRPGATARFGGERAERVPSVSELRERWISRAGPRLSIAAHIGFGSPRGAVRGPPVPTPLPRAAAAHATLTPAESRVWEAAACSRPGS